MLPHAFLPVSLNYAPGCSPGQNSTVSLYPGSKIDTLHDRKNKHARLFTMSQLLETNIQGAGRQLAGGRPYSVDNGRGVCAWFFVV